MTSIIFSLFSDLKRWKAQTILVKEREKFPEGSEELAEVLAKHEDVDAIDYSGTYDGSVKMRRLGAKTMKRVHVDFGEPVNWFQQTDAEKREHRRRLTEVKTIWTPFGTGVG